MSQTRKFDHISVRLDREIKTQLEKDARRRGINLNSLINLILSRFVSFDDIIEQAEAVPLNKPLFSGMLESIQTEEMERVGRELGPTVVKQTFAFLGLNFDLESLIEHYFQPVSTSPDGIVSTLLEAVQIEGSCSAITMAGSGPRFSSNTLAES